jgi:sensor histidine kinase regulating citrate/malate metabolism
VLSAECRQPGRACDEDLRGRGRAHEEVALVATIWRPYRAKTPLSYNGLGLYVVRQRVDPLGTDIAIENTPTTGSIFRVCLPTTGTRSAEIAA